MMGRKSVTYIGAMKGGGLLDMRKPRRIRTAEYRDSSKFRPDEMDRQ